MKIRFIKEWNGEVIEGFDEKEDSITSSYEETFKVGDIEEGDIVNDDIFDIDFQFGDGSMVYGLPKESIEVIEE